MDHPTPAYAALAAEASNNVPPSIDTKSLSQISQRLLGNFLPLLNKPVGKVRSNQKDGENDGSAAAPPAENPSSASSNKRNGTRETLSMQPRLMTHDYEDFASERDENGDEIGLGNSFPMRLHSALLYGHAHLAAAGVPNGDDVISWQPHGRCFLIKNPKVFASVVMPNFFKHNNYTSLQRQLNIYGFKRLTRGRDIGAYYHPLFLRGKEFLTKRMIRTKIKGTRFKSVNNPATEPNFYEMPPVESTKKVALPPSYGINSRAAPPPPSNLNTSSISESKEPIDRARLITPIHNFSSPTDSLSQAFEPIPLPMFPSLSDDDNGTISLLREGVTILFGENAGKERGTQLSPSTIDETSWEPFRWK